MTLMTLAEATIILKTYTQPMTPAQLVLYKQALKLVTNGHLKGPT